MPLFHQLHTNYPRLFQLAQGAMTTAVMRLCLLLLSDQKVEWNSASKSSHIATISPALLPGWNLMNNWSKHPLQRELHCLSHPVWSHSLWIRQCSLQLARHLLDWYLLWCASALWTSHSKIPLDRPTSIQQNRNCKRTGANAEHKNYILWQFHEFYFKTQTSSKFEIN